MNTFKALFKLEFLNKKSQRSAKKSVARSILKVFGYVFFISFLCLILSILSNSLISTFKQVDMQNEILVFYILFIQILIIIFSIGKVVKTLYNQIDYNKLLHMPIKPSVLFITKSLYLFLSNFVISAVLTLPFLICFGVKTMQGMMYYIMLIPSLIFIPLIPFVVSMLLSLPFSRLSSLLRNKFLFTLILYIIALGIGFTAYYFLIMNLVTLFNAGDNVSSVLSADLVNGLKSFANAMFLQQLFKYMLIGSGVKAVQSFAILFSILFVSCFIIVMFAKKKYGKVIKTLIEMQVNCFKKEVPIKERSPKMAFFVKELLVIFRSQNYSFQYITIAVTTPLMVYFSNLIVASIGVSKIGKQILPGISVLVLIMFLAMATSFSASTITREGDKFIYTKLFPVKYSQQITMKFLVYVMVAVPSTLVSCILLYIGGFLTIIETLVIGIGVSLIQIGNIALSISIDIKSPKFSYVGDYELVESNSNMSKSLIASFLIAFLLGITTIIVSYCCSIEIKYIVILGFAIPYTTYQLFWLFFRLNKKYKRIEC